GWIQDYPGADQGRVRYLLIPTYKSKHLTIDRQDGIKGDLLERDRFQFSVSFSFLFPTDADKITGRAGMPDLEWTLQLGPELRIELMHNHFHTMYLRLPFRFVVNTDFYHKFDYLDWNFAPGFRNVFDLGKGVGEIVTRFEVDYASEAYNDLFYQVDAAYATASRPAFDAKGGIMEYIVGINYAYYDFFPWTLFIGANAYYLQNAKNRQSPLVFKETNYSVIGGVVRYF
ncbi:MAG: MipA/OmpV family protein, partial [Bdellovibrionaceae bacterium]|nr:MipA/OmpV family protein [Pseudobdellovibrionaceae bacterium]